MFASIEGFFLDMLIMGGLLVFAVSRIFGAIDRDGEIKKAASNGFAECIKKLFKL